MADPFMTSEPIPKTMPRSTLACPPAKNFTDQLKGSTQSQARLSSNLRENEDDRKFGDEEKQFGSKGNRGNNFGTTGNNFRVSSKDTKGLQASTKNLGTFNPPASKKGIFTLI